MIITEWEQGTEQWLKERLGVPSASNFHQIIDSKGKRSKSRKTYMYKLASDAVMGEVVQGYKNNYMEEGNEREDESRGYYEFTNNVKVEQVGFCYKDDKKLFGCSPDGLINKDGGFETKNKMPHLQAKYLDNPKYLLTEYHRQVMGCLLVTGREWWDLVSYCRGMKQVVLRVERDEDFIKILHEELLAFSEELNELINKIR